MAGSRVCVRAVFIARVRACVSALFLVAAVSRSFIRWSGFAAPDVYCRTRQLAPIPSCCIGAN
nr:hypothetical protein CWKEJDCK_CWKEJDCK_CDS_0008 [Microvirus sp.]